MGLSCRKIGGEITVGVVKNGDIIPFCEITVDTTTSDHIKFEKPFIVEAGDVINFISKTGNSLTENTVASLLIELF